MSAIFHLPVTGFRHPCRNDGFSQTLVYNDERRAWERYENTLGDKLLPQLLTYLGERSTVMVDNLDKAERLGWITSTDMWLETRQLRNQMVHDYIETPAILLNALNAGHEFVPELAGVVNRMLSEIETRMGVGLSDAPRS